MLNRTSELSVKAGFILLTFPFASASALAWPRAAAYPVFEVLIFCSACSFGTNSLFFRNTALTYC